MKLATLRSSSTTMMRIALAALLRVSAVVASGEPAARRGGIRLERVGVAARQLHEADPYLAVAYHDGQQRGRGRLRDSETAADLGRRHRAHVLETIQDLTFELGPPVSHCGSSRDVVGSRRRLRGARRNNRVAR